MIANILKDLNWVDVVITLMIVWVLFTGIKNGLVKGLLHLIGTIFALFICFHYYSSFSGLFVKKTPLSPSTIDVSVFLFLWFVSFLIFRFIEEAVFFIFTVEVKNVIDKWGSAVLAIARAALIGSMCMFVLLLTQNQYLQQQTFSSFMRKGLLSTAPNVYFSLYEDIVRPLFPSENKNKQVVSVLRGANKSSNVNHNDTEHRKETSLTETNQ